LRLVYGECINSHIIAYFWKEVYKGGITSGLRTNCSLLAIHAIALSLLSREGKMSYGEIYQIVKKTARLMDKRNKNIAITALSRISMNIIALDEIVDPLEFAWIAMGLDEFPKYFSVGKIREDKVSGVRKRFTYSKIRKPKIVTFETLRQ